MAGRFSVEPQKLLSTLKNTVFKNATDDELLALVVVANEYGLNPLLKEIYAFPAKGGGIVPVVSIDGWVNRMNSNPQFDGIEFEDKFDDNGKPVSVTAIIYRKDRGRPVKVTEYYAECRRNTEPWNTMPARMLRHKALCQCVRVAFGFGGVFDEDEARDVAMRDVTPAATETVKPKFLNQPPATPAPESDPVQLPSGGTVPRDVHDAALAASNASAPVDDSDQQAALFQTITEAMDEDAISAPQVRKWAASQKIIQSDKLALKSLPVAQLRQIVERWTELRGGQVA